MPLNTLSITLRNCAPEGSGAKATVGPAASGPRMPGSRRCKRRRLPFRGKYRVQRLEFFPAAIASRTADIGRNDRESLRVQAKARDQFSRKQRGGFEFWSDPDVSRGKTDEVSVAQLY
jgi:hypothetical protein